MRLGVLRRRRVVRTDHVHLLSCGDAVVEVPTVAVDVVDTIGAEAAIDCVRCTQPGSPAGIDDGAWIVQRGDVARDPGSSFN